MQVSAAGCKGQEPRCKDTVLADLLPDVEVLPCPEGDVDGHHPPQGGQDGLPVGMEARQQYCQQTRGGGRACQKWDGKTGFMQTEAEAEIHHHASSRGRQG